MKARLEYLGGLNQDLDAVDLTCYRTKILDAVDLTCYRPRGIGNLIYLFAPQSVASTAAVISWFRRHVEMSVILSTFDPGGRRERSERARKAGRDGKILRASP